MQLLLLELLASIILTNGTEAIIYCFFFQLSIKQV